MGAAVPVAGPEWIRLRIWKEGSGAVGRKRAWLAPLHHPSLRFSPPLPSHAIHSSTPTLYLSLFLTAYSPLIRLLSRHFSHSRSHLSTVLTPTHMLLAVSLYEPFFL
ncbi:hypothetical protein FHV99_004644 [Ochrobactrum sp. P20RRXII]|nr:hypothetical protein [Ochrobactrum sp. P20RRXII]